jgi:HIRAN domain
MGWFKRRRAPASRLTSAPVEPTGSSRTPAPPAARLPTADETARAAGYRDAAHQAASIRGKAARAARTPADQVARAKQVGMVARAEYLTAEQEAVALRPALDGFPDARLERVRDRLLVVTAAGWVNPKSRSAHKVGLHMFQLRGSGHYEAALKAGKFTPGSPLKIAREPDNPHDPNAIAVYAEGARNKAGYVPAARAKTLAKLLDNGADLVAISVRGSGRGTGGGTIPHILICERALFDHLNGDEFGSKVTVRQTVWMEGTYFEVAQSAGPVWAPSGEWAVVRGCDAVRRRRRRCAECRAASRSCSPGRRLGPGPARRSSG